MNLKEKIVKKYNDMTPYNRIKTGIATLATIALLTTAATAIKPYQNTLNELNQMSSTEASFAVEKINDYHSNIGEFVAAKVYEARNK